MIRKPSALGAAAFLCAAFLTPARASVLIVDDDDQGVFECEGAPHRTINEALAISKPGDEIRVCPGVYPEQVVLNEPIRLTGLPQGTVRPVINPTALPESRPSLLGGNPVTAAILIDNDFVRITNIDIDLAGVTASTCLPFVTGVYV